MPEPTPSQLKIDGMPETEVLRIEGNVTVEAEDVQVFKLNFYELIEKFAGTFAGNITDQDSPTGMRLYRVEEVEEIKRERDGFYELSKSLDEINKSNDKAYSDLAGQLAKEKKRSKDLYTILSDENASKFNEILKLMEKIEALELRLRVKDSPIKALLKRIWKWFKGLVGK